MGRSATRAPRSDVHCPRLCQAPECRQDLRVQQFVSIDGIRRARGLISRQGECCIGALSGRVVCKRRRGRGCDMPRILGSVQARRKCGIGRASDQKLAISSSGRENVASKSWGHLSYIWSSSRIRRSVFTSKPSWTEFPPSPTCSQRGLCCAMRSSKSQLHHQAPVTAHTGLRWSMMTRCGGVPVPSCGSWRACARVALGRLLPLAFGGVGLRRAVSTATAAYSASWGDSLEMTARHPSFAKTFVREWEGPSDSQHLQRAARAAVQLANMEDFEVPSWSELAAGARPPLRRGLIVVGCSTRQHEAARGSFSGGVAVPGTGALLRSQSNMSFSVVPSDPLVRTESQLFRLLLLRHLRLPFPPTSLAHMPVWPSS